MSKLEAFLDKIPELIGAMEPKQLHFFLIEAFKADLEGRTDVFDGEDPLARLTILIVWPCKDAVAKQHVIDLLRLKMVSHGVEKHRRDEWDMRRMRLAELLRGEESFNATVSAVFSVDDAVKSEWA